MAQNKTDSSIPSGAGDNAATKTDSTSGKAAAGRKKQQNQKSQKANPPAKKKQPPPQKSTFLGIASGVNPMKGIVIADGNGNKAGQFRVFQKKLAGSAAEDKAYGLDSAILDLTAKKRSDFIKPKPDPAAHSNLTPVMESDGTTPTGEIKLVCYDPILRDQMDAEYSMDLKIQSSNWNQYSRMEEGYYRTAIGNIDSNVLTYCRMDKRMSNAERDKNLILLLLILRSVCAQNHGTVKVDEEYKNLCTLHSAVGFKQLKAVTDTDFADEVLDRYESAIFTCGKFIAGQYIYDKVLTSYSTPMTFKEYLLLSDAEQDPIDNIVKERIVARLIIKNSLNSNARAELMKTYSVNNNSCYPNTISEALSLLVTFKMEPITNNNRTEDEATVSYHEAVDPVVEYDAVIDPDDDSIHTDHVNDIIDNDKSTENAPRVRFDATVMASVINEATANADEDQFIGASFAQLQDVDDVYEDDEPDVVCCAHVAYELDDEGDEPIFVTEANNNAELHNERVRSNRATITRESDPTKDFELMLYHTSQRVLHKDSQTVGIFHYEPGRPDFISHTYGRNIPESIIDYSDALRFKFNCAGIHDNRMLMAIMFQRTDADVMAILKQKFNDVGLKGLNTSTVKYLREESIRTLAHRDYNCHRYHSMEREIGVDAVMETFPRDNTILHHVVSSVAINQNRRKPNRWVNKITHKLINAGITSITLLESKLNDGSLNDYLDDHDMARLHAVTIKGLSEVIGTSDFRQGRS
jgi:hypothetical protein